MSDDDDVTKLEALLERAMKGRTPGQQAVPPPSEEPDWKGPLDAPTPVAAFMPSSIPPPPSSDPDLLDRPTPITPFVPSSIPPAPSTQRGTEPRRVTLRPGNAPGLFGLVPPDSPPEPPPMEVVELEVDSIPSVPPPPASGSDPLESRSRLVSAPPMAPDASEPHVPSAPSIEVAAADISATELAALEAEHMPPSSRRPISMEAKMNDPGDDAIPLHTPPPESGKLRAAAPAIELEAVHPELPAHAEVAVFVGGPRSLPIQKTFGELLDEALSL